jgi:thymidylate synthase
MTYYYYAPIKGYEDNNKQGTHPSISVVLGWFPINRFIKKYDASNYCSVGNLFDGINGTKKLIANLLFNTHITDVILCEITKEDRFNKPCQLAKEDIESYRLKNGSLLTDYVRVHFVTDEEGLQETLEDIKYHTLLDNIDKPMREKELLEIENVVTKVKPTFPIGQNFRAKTVEIAHIEMLRRIRNTGELEDNLQELLALTVTVTDEFDSLAALDLMDAETKKYCLSYIYGSESEHSYGYGDRLTRHFGFNQIDEIVNKLKGEIGSKSSVLSLFEPQDLIRGKSPCLTQIWVRVRSGELSLFANLRSNDILRAYPLNAYALRVLQIYLSDKVGVKVGYLTTTSFSAHIYEDCFKTIDELLLKHPHQTTKLALDPIGNFVITWLIDGRLSCTHLSPSGVFITEYKNTKEKKILDEIIYGNPTIDLNHLAYLSRELTWCSILQDKYKQDYN